MVEAFIPAARRWCGSTRRRDSISHLELFTITLVFQLQPRDGVTAVIGKLWSIQGGRLHPTEEPLVAQVEGGIASGVEIMSSDSLHW